MGVVRAEYEAVWVVGSAGAGVGKGWLGSASFGRAGAGLGPYQREAGGQKPSRSRAPLL